MDSITLSNSLFADNITAMPRQYETKLAERAEPFAERVENSEPQWLAAAEQNQARRGEPLEFKRTLDEQSGEQARVQQDEEENTKSDKPSTDNTTNYVLAAAGAVSTEVETLGQQADISQISAEQKALAVLTYLEEGKLADNTGNAGEAISEVVDKMLGQQSGNETIATETSELTTDSANVLGKAVQQSDLAGTGNETAKAEQITQNQQAIGKELPEQEIKQEAVGGQPDTQAVELNISNQTESVDSQQVKAGAAEVLNKDVVAGTKTAGQNDTAAKGANQQEQAEQISEGLTGQIKSSTDKETSKNETGSLLKQNNGEPRYIGVINTDTAEKEAEVSKTSQPEQQQFGKEVFDKVGEQLQASISNSVRQGESEVTVRLNPPELGRVVIKLQQQDGQVTGLLEFSKAEIKAEVQQLLPQLVRNLQDAGITVRKLDVVQAQVDNSGQQQSREHVAGDGTAYQQQFAQGQSNNYGLGYDWLSAEGVYAGLESLSQTSEESPSYISDQAVNILV